MSAWMTMRSAAIQSVKAMNQDKMKYRISNATIRDYKTDEILFDYSDIENTDEVYVNKDRVAFKNDSHYIAKIQNKIDKPVVKMELKRIGSFKEHCYYFIENLFRKMKLI